MSGKSRHTGNMICPLQVLTMAVDSTMDGLLLSGVSKDPLTFANTVDLAKSQDSRAQLSQDLAAVREESPSAADYDPVHDRQVDDQREEAMGHRRVDTASATAYAEPIPDIKADPIRPSADKAVVQTNAQDANEFDMFAVHEDDMFADPDDSQPSQLNLNAAALIDPQEVTMLDEWDDEQGYYKAILGESLNGRYYVQANLGKGMFSGVVRALDTQTQKLVAIKIVRRNETMTKAGVQEIKILEQLNAADPEDQRHIVRLIGEFEHKNHLCMVFENLSMNLREALKKFGKDVGINMRVIRVYARQMFLGLSLLRKCNIIHADIKPDNILINEARSSLKICDLGSATDGADNPITPYLVSRFYRAPEIILGLPYDCAIDVWAIGCTLYELFTGRILFAGRSNNQMLRAIMECQGKFSHKLLRRAAFTDRHFDDTLVFRSVEKDKMTGNDVVRMLPMTRPTRDLRTRLFGDPKGLPEDEARDMPAFIELLNRCLDTNPEKRITPKEALAHPFFTKVKV